MINLIKKTKKNQWTKKSKGMKIYIEYLMEL